MFDPIAQILPLWSRFVIVLTVFAFLGYRDWKNNKEDPKRLKEYLFLVASALLSVVFGVLHDLVTVNISPEYFIYAKELSAAPNGFYSRVIWLAIKASYSVGLVIGLVYLIANNPIRKTPQLSYPKLYRYLTFPALGALLFGILGGLSFYLLFKDAADPDFPHLRSPGSFTIVTGIHYGTYLGALLGLILGTVKIRFSRGDMKIFRGMLWGSILVSIAIAAWGYFMMKR